MSDNFFVNALYQYYLQSGKKMSGKIVQVLSKSILDLSDEEKETYRTLVLPSMATIKESLAMILNQLGTNREEWEAQLQIHGQSIIGQMVGEVLIELEAPRVSVSEAIPQPSMVEAVQIPSESSPAISTQQPIQPPPPPYIPPPKAKLGRPTKKTLIIVGIVIIAVIAAGIIVGIVASSDNEPAKTEAKSGDGLADSTKPQPIPLSISSPQAGQKVANPEIMVAGQTEAGATVQIYLENTIMGHCTADDSGSFSTVIVLPSEPKSYSLKVKAKKDSGEATKTVVCEVIQDPGVYKAKCQPLDYRVVSKNADNYIGQFYYIRGQVFQIQESGNSTFMLVSVTDKGYGIWGDNVAVFFDGKTDALEGSIVRVWGECGGNYTYTSIAQYTITVPKINAEYLEVERL